MNVVVSAACRRGLPVDDGLIHAECLKHPSLKGRRAVPQRARQASDGIGPHDLLRQGTHFRRRRNRLRRCDRSLDDSRVCARRLHGRCHTHPAAAAGGEEIVEVPPGELVRLADEKGFAKLRRRGVEGTDDRLDDVVDEDHVRRRVGISSQHERVIPQGRERANDEGSRERPVDPRWSEDDRSQASPAGLGDRPLGQVFGPAVADAASLDERRAFIESRRHPVSVHRHAADVDEASHTRAERGLGGAPRAVHRRRKRRFWRPSRADGTVHHRVAVLHGAGHVGGRCDIADRDVDGEPRQSSGTGWAAHQSADVPRAAQVQALHRTAAEKAAGAGDQHPRPSARGNCGRASGRGCRDESSIHPRLVHRSGRGVTRFDRAHDRHDRAARQLRIAPRLNGRDPVVELGTKRLVPDDVAFVTPSGR